MGVVSHWADHMLCCVDTAPRANIGHQTETRRDIIGDNYSKMRGLWAYKLSANEFITGTVNDMI